jgi:hypothetical protein
VAEHHMPAVAVAAAESIGNRSFVVFLVHCEI